MNDPYVRLELSGFHGPSSRKQYEWVEALRSNAQTHSKPRTLNPRWDNLPYALFKIKRHGAVLKVLLFDRDELGADDPLGHCLLRINDMVPSEEDQTKWFALKDPGESSITDELVDDVDMDEKHGPAVLLRFRLQLDTFGELCSYLWAPPDVRLAFD